MRKLGVIVWIVALGAIVAMCSGGEPAPPRSAQYERDLGPRGACREFITRSLHNPRSADFPGPEGWAVTHDGARAVVEVTIRATNAFGGVVASRFRCEVRRGDGTFTLVALTEL